MKSYDEVVAALVGSEGGLWEPAPFASVELVGVDAMDFLQRLCSQDVVAIPVGGSAPAAFLDGRGRLQFVVWVARTGPEEFLILTQSDRREALAEFLERYHFTEQLQIGMGQDAWQLLVSHEHRAVGAQVFDERDGLHFAFGRALAGQAPRLEEGAAESVRLCGGLVFVGRDTEAKTLALEAPLDAHISTTKGCYTGQEIVARIHTYGHTNRSLCLLGIEGSAVIDPGAALVELEDGDPVGRVMVSSAVPEADMCVARGFLPNAFVPKGTQLALSDLEGRRVEVLR